MHWTINSQNIYYSNAYTLKLMSSSEEYGSFFSKQKMRLGLYRAKNDETKHPATQQYSHSSRIMPCKARVGGGKKEEPNHMPASTQIKPIKKISPTYLSECLPSSTNISVKPVKKLLPINTNDYNTIQKQKVFASIRLIEKSKTALNNYTLPKRIQKEKEK